MFGLFFCAHNWFALLVAWLGALLVVAHAAVHGWVKYAINDWYRDFYNLLEAAGALSANTSATTADWEFRQSQVESSLWAFAQIAVGPVVIMPIAKFIRSMWALRWRLVLMRAYVVAWDPNLPALEGASQRVHEDSYRFARGVELCLTTVLDSIITLAVFIPILTNLGTETPCPKSLGAFAFFEKGWLVGVAVTSALVGLAVTVGLGHKLVRLEIENQVAEAKLRRDLVLLETTPRVICDFYHVTDAANTEGASDAVATDNLAMGDSVVPGTFLAPIPHFMPIFAGIRRNYDRLFLNFTALNLWLALFDQFNVLLPYIIFSPLLFNPNPVNRILLGTLVQVSNSFDKVFGSLNTVAENWAGINEFRSVLVRLKQFERNVFRNVPFHPILRSRWPILESISRTRASVTRFAPTIQVEQTSVGVIEDFESSMRTSRV